MGISLVSRFFLSWAFLPAKKSAFERARLFDVSVWCKKERGDRELKKASWFFISDYVSSLQDQKMQLEPNVYFLLLVEFTCNVAALYHFISDPLLVSNQFVASGGAICLN